MSVLSKIVTNDTVTYIGDNRDNLRDRNGKVLSIGVHDHNSSQDMVTVQMEDSGEIVYGARWAWKRVDNLLNPKFGALSNTKDFDMEEIFTAAAGGKLEVAKNEIARLEARIAELNKFVEVYGTL